MKAVGLRTNHIIVNTMDRLLIAKVKWHNHPVLHDLELDFCNSAGEPYDNIILAGENGTGKTSILTSMAEVIQGGPLSRVEYLEYDVDGKKYRASQIADESLDKLGWYQMTDLQTGVLSRVSFGRGAGGGNDVGDAALLAQESNLRRYGCCLSKARSDFQTGRISATTTMSTDASLNNIDGSNDFTPLKQLLVDIESQDNTEYRKLNKARGVNPLSEMDFYIQYSKIYRFSNAYNRFFDEIQYSGVEDRDGEKTILFSKQGKEISIDKMSTGEKQIVFRGAYILSNVKKTSVAMVDEPEISMHPKWQDKILAYYQTLFMDSTNKQVAQLFFATHSDYVVKNALKDKTNNLVIVLKDKNGTIAPTRVDAPSKLSVITAAETNYLAFGICSVDYHIELFSALQQRFGLTDLKTVDQYILSSPVYDAAKHGKFYSCVDARGVLHEDKSLPVYIRNGIDHPESGRTYTVEELRISIELLRELL